MIDRNPYTETLIAETLAHLDRPDLTRESITLLIVRLLELRNPDKTGVVQDDLEMRLIGPGGASTQIFIHNLLAECDQDPASRPEIVERYLRGLSPESNNSGPQITRDDVVALVRDSTYRDFIASDDRSVRPKHLIADLWIVYALDRPQSTTVLLVRDATELGISSMDLDFLSTANLERLLSDLEIVSYGEWSSFTSKSSEYLVGALLLDYVWDQVQALVHGDVVVAVPARDTVIFTGSSNAVGLKRLREVAESVFKSGNHVISTTLLRRAGDTWKLLA